MPLLTLLGPERSLGEGYCFSRPRSTCYPPQAAFGGPHIAQTVVEDQVQCPRLGVHGRPGAPPPLPCLSLDRNRWCHGPVCASHYSKLTASLVTTAERQRNFVRTKTPEQHYQDCGERTRRMGENIYKHLSMGGQACCSSDHCLRNPRAWPGLSAPSGQFLGLPFSTFGNFPAKAISI